MKRPTILVLTDYYLPGYKAGGPVRSLANLVSRLGNDFRFRIVTRDRDIGERVPYADISTGCWTPVGGADVLYLRESQLSPWKIRKVIRHTPHDALYLNGMFSVPFSMSPLAWRRAAQIPWRPIVLASLGQLAISALSKSPRRKRVYLQWLRLTGSLSDLTWQASSQYEAEDICREFPSAKVMVVPDATAPPPAAPSPRDKQSGKAKVAFLSRVHPVKNLDFALSILGRVRGQVEFNIYGPIEDQSYWNRCQETLRELPSNISVQQCGPVAPDHVPGILSHHDALFLPTRGENFGHVILESFLSGTPVLISDQTPWRGLQEHGVGWDLALANEEGFVHAINELVAMDNCRRYQIAKRSWQYGSRICDDESVVDQARQLFMGAVWHTEQIGNVIRAAA